MLEEAALLAVYLGLVLFTAKLFEDLARRAGLPGFIGAILAGFLLGPGGLGLLSREDVEKMGLMLTLGIEFMLFLAGAEELSEVKGRMGWREATLTGALLTLTTLSVAATLHVLTHALPLNALIAYGLVMAIVSLGPLVHTLIDTGFLSTEEGALLVKVGALAEAAGIVLFNMVYGGFNIYTAVSTPLVFLAVYLFGRRVLTRILYAVEDYISAKEAPFAAIVAMVLTASYLAELLGFNAAVTALLLGIFASEYLSERPAYMERLRAFTYGFFEPLFFAGIGLNMPCFTPSTATLTVLLAGVTALPKLVVVAAAGLLPAGIAILAKGGVDAALLLTLYTGLHGRMPASLYGAGVSSMLLLSTLMALAMRRYVRRESRREPWRLRVGELPLSYDVVRANDTLLTVSMLLSLGSGAVVVIDEEGRPIGYITASDLIYVSPRDMKRLKARDVMRTDIHVVKISDRVSELLKEHVMAQPIIAVVDEDGRIVGTLNPQKILRLLYSPRPTRR